ncbi:hypothetical protein BK126_05120 [Paenibacillus sp. FSL H7-0326]|uniref:hypothetical protein n=1 Tax=Paenibacillus sp. FSL H7-0326 TaxID=1921144 RepID=UPI00096DC566|nr:hypothetical protein [Paenibacillus sp. FSL H7-0326]OMC71467.1 hypothetical protein BK126_05120 [Paenibacillus sp. FSL H7-0326]
MGNTFIFPHHQKVKTAPYSGQKIPSRGEFEEILGEFPFWDPNLFVDDDSRIYFTWGCSNITPIYGVELNPEAMKAKDDPSHVSNIALLLVTPAYSAYSFP